MPMLLTYPRLKARRLFCEFSRGIGMDSQLSDVPPEADHHNLINLIMSMPLGVNGNDLHYHACFGKLQLL